MCWKGNSKTEVSRLRIEEYLRREVIIKEERKEIKSTMCRFWGNECLPRWAVGPRFRGRSPETQGSSGNPAREVAKPCRQVEFLRKGEWRESQPMLYSPRGDLKSVVKYMEEKLRYPSVDRESRFCMFRYFGYFLTLSFSVCVCFLQRYFPDLYTESESALYTEHNSHK